MANFFGFEEPLPAVRPIGQTLDNCENRAIFFQSPIRAQNPGVPEGPRFFFSGERGFLLRGTGFLTSGKWAFIFGATGFYTRFVSFRGRIKKMRKSLLSAINPSQILRLAL
jgi:hypothetical protein